MNHLFFAIALDFERNGCTTAPAAMIIIATMRSSVSRT